MHYRLLVYSYAEIAELLGTGLLSFFACTLLTIGIVSIVVHYSFQIIEVPGIKYGKRLAKEY